MRPILLDTCALLWLVEGAPLSKAASDALAANAAAGESAYVSHISAWEIGMIVARGRLKIPMAPLAWFEAALGQSKIALAEMPPSVLIASSLLPGSPPRDPSDRIIAATARELGFRLMTRDRKLLAYAAEGHLQAVAC